VRVVIADDNLLMREGIASVLRSAGIEVAAQATSAEELLHEVDAQRPDAAIVDIRMPPTHSDEGLVAAHKIRRRHPRIAIVIVSQHVEVGTAMRLLAQRPERLGYLLKDRVSDVDDFVDALRRVVAGGSALDPQVVSQLLTSSVHAGSLESLTPGERRVIAQVVEGRSNKGIGERFSISERAVQKHVTSIFAKLDLPMDEDDNRRILAVLAYLRSDRPRAAASTPS
jgi:DNA-binding NarL/FixJ family response regulator